MKFKGTFWRKKGLPEIKTMPAEMQVCTGWKGAYNLLTGAIEIGSTERDTPNVLWHEFMHKELFEKESLESGVMWDRIAKHLEMHLFGKEKGIEDLAYVYTQPEKKAEYVKPRHLTLAEKGLSKEEKEEDVFGLGITTYKSGNIKDYKKEAKEIANTIHRELIKKLDVEVLDNSATIGVYKGSQEPSYSPVLKGIINPIMIDKITVYRKRYNQESAILYKFNKGKNQMLLFSGIKDNINELQDIILNASNKKIGGFLTYYFEKEEAMIINIPQFDNTDFRDFRKMIPEIKKQVTAAGFKMKTGMVDVIIL